MSTLNQHLVRRGAIYHFRRRLPTPLKEILSRSHFDGSLQTADPAHARRLARKVSVALDQLAERLQEMSPALKPTPGQLNLVLKELFDNILRDGDRRRELIGDDFTALPNGNRQEIIGRSAAGTGSASRRSTAGSRSTAGWVRRIPHG